MVAWIILPLSLSMVSLIGSWSVYALASYNNHVCFLSDWTVQSYCQDNRTAGCCLVPTISASGSNFPENSLFTATINAGSFLFLLFSIFHHAHIMERHSCQSLLSKTALVFGLVAAVGAFAAGNCNPEYVTLLHYLGAAISFMCICFYTVLLTALTGKCALTGYEKILFPLRVASTVVQVTVTICYTILFVQSGYFYSHLAAVFEWMLNVNLDLFELSYTVEFVYFSSYMVTNLLTKRDEEKPLMMTMT
ncbi:transmembrane protein 150A [Mugil cephalus]|uniref:transmembrane protein 150A n=1 Tax=Mugil cephalus TaxID=48193 RepID=UPI001FB82D0D|nr:transmembrane protein 150A [Mugil cephalus]